MKWMKIAALLLLALALMRLCSWGLGWMLTKVLHINSKASAIVSNITAFFLFALLLYSDLEKGELVDTNAILFGVVVFAVYATTDMFWVPWRVKKHGAAATD